MIHGLTNNQYRFQGNIKGCLKFFIKNSLVDTDMFPNHALISMADFVILVTSITQIVPVILVKVSGSFNAMVRHAKYNLV